MSQMRSIEFRNTPEIREIAQGTLIRSGCSGPAVAAIQAGLSRAGYDLSHSSRSESVFDGIFGPATCATLQEFQSHQHIAGDGIVGPVTIQRLDDCLFELEALPVPDVSLRKLFKVEGTPAPKNLPSGFIWNPGKYVRAVYQALEDLYAEGEVPKLVINSIRRTITIKPYEDASIHQATALGRRININPGTFDRKSPIYQKSNYRRLEPLLHELCHSMRNTNGKEAADKEAWNIIHHPDWIEEKSMPPKGNRLNFEKRAEFYAITIVNIHRSALTPVPVKPSLRRSDAYVRLLRKDHVQDYPLVRPDLIHTTAKFKSALKTLWSEQADFCGAMARVAAPYNPIRDVRRS